MKIPIAHEWNVRENPMMGMQWVRKYHWSMRDLIYPSSTGTLTCVKSIVTSVESVLPPCPNDSL
jgi:hypothetical protein